MITINDKKDCMGCYACLNICPQKCIFMDSANEGFWYPRVDYNNCVKCGLCIKVCPTINKVELRQNYDVKAYACKNKNNDIRLKSSSGGLFTLLAEQVIDKGGIVFGAGFDKNFAVIHSYVETKDGLGKFRGSKYVQSKIGNTYKQAMDFLVKGRDVLFTGTPCQIAGLENYLGQNYDNLLCQDIICHGVPSPMVWEEYMVLREKKARATIESVSFRNKIKGWKEYSLLIVYENGIKYSHTIHDDMYLVGFNNSLYLRPSCYDCSYKTKQRQSDITLADFWGAQNVLPEMDDDKGISLVLIHSSKGQKAFDKIKDKMIMKQVDFKDAVKYNPAMIKSVKINPSREKFFAKLNVIEFSVLMKKHCTVKLVIRIKRKIKNAIKKMLICLGLFDLVKKVYYRIKNQQTIIV
jgi:coenzyme F420-reducing hydrogenase beta subunit